MGIQEAIGTALVALLAAIVVIAQKHSQRMKANSERPPPEGVPHVVYVSVSELKEVVRGVVREELDYLRRVGSWHGD